MILHKFLSCLVNKTCNLCFYLVLLVFVGVIDQTLVIKVEIYLCFSFLSANMYFENVIIVAIAITEFIPDKF